MCCLYQSFLWHKKLLLACSRPINIEKFSPCGAKKIGKREAEIIALSLMILCDTSNGTTLLVAAKNSNLVPSILEGNSLGVTLSDFEKNLTMKILIFIKSMEFSKCLRLPIRVNKIKFGGMYVVLL